MEKITLSNQKEVCIGFANFSDALDLKDAIFKELATQNIDISNLAELNLEDIAKTELKSDLFGIVIKAVLNLDSSKEITKAVFKCFEQCTYDKEKITSNTFEDSAARPFYMQIKYEVIKANMLPFFQNLASLSKKAAGLVKEMGSLK